MKRSFLVVCILFCTLLGGCAFWMDGERLSVTPHQEQIPQAGDEVIEVFSNAEMQSAVVNLIESGADRGILTASAFSRGTLHYYADAAIESILQNNPVAAYAVNKITYEIGTNRGEPVIAFNIDYIHDRSEILRIKPAKSMSDAESLIYGALANCEESLVLHIKQYKQIDFAQLIQDYGNNNPNIVMEIPRIVTNTYPEQGDDRVIELIFTYQTSRDQLREMQELVSTVFTSAELYVDETANVSGIFSQLYAFLMERHDYVLETSITPAYSLLHHGVGDSRAFANIYGKMCRQEALDCRVVTGTRNGQPWCWNIIRYRGVYYHVDLLYCKEIGKFSMQDPFDMDGYVWDYNVYPLE